MAKDGEGRALTLEELLTRKRVLVGLAVTYWVLAVFASYGMGVHEQGHIASAMHDLERFYPGDARLGHINRAATEQGSEAELVSLLCFGALFLILIVAWRVREMLRLGSDERAALRRAARRAPFETPFVGEPAPILADPSLAEPPVEPAG
jgi:hypothetical protein